MCTCSLSKNSLRTSLTTVKFGALPGRGLIVANVIFSFLGCARKLATMQTISGRLGMSSQIIPGEMNGLGSLECHDLFRALSRVRLTGESLSLCLSGFY